MTSKKKGVPSLTWKKFRENGWANLRAYWTLRSATSLGKRVRLYGWADVKNAGIFHIANHVQLVSTIIPLQLYVGKQGTLEIHERTYINYGCSISAQKHISIGTDCRIGTHAIIMDNNFHRLEPERRHERPKSKPIIIEDNVWLGARVIVLAGVTIGAGSAIGAGSIVTKDIPPRSLAVGSPARVIRTL